MRELFGKSARDEFETVGGPGFGFLLGTGMSDDEKALEFEHGFFEALVTRL